MKILAVDDSKATLMIIDKALTDAGYSVIFATDGKVAWEIMQAANAPSIIVSDWQMPELDGLELCRRLRTANLSPAPYFILLTGANTPEEIAEGYAAGINDYLHKPFGLDVLRERVAKAVAVLGITN